MSRPYPTGGRGSGRTTWMIQQVVDEVGRGQPLCIVYGHTLAFSCGYLRDKTMQELDRCEIPFSKVSKNEIECHGKGEGSRIIFLNHSNYNSRKKAIAMKGSEFIDHAVYEHQHEHEIYTPPIKHKKRMFSKDWEIE